MKKILKDMKLNSLVSVLHIILGLSAISIVILFLQRDIWMQFLGMRPKTGEMQSEDLIMSGLALLMLLFVLWMLLQSLSGRVQKKAKEFISGLDSAEQEKLTVDYQNAWRGSRTIRIGRKYTYVLDSREGIYLNRDIIWIYAWKESKRSNGVTSNNYYFNLYRLGKEEPDIIGTTQKTYPEILEYFKNNFPHIVIGDSDEVRYLYRNDRDKFMQLRYYTVNDPGENQQSIVS